MLKRDFLKNAAALALNSLFSPTVLARAQEDQHLREARATPLVNGPHALPPLPYAFDALEPHIDARTMEIHHDAHHKSYVSKLNEAVTGKPEEKLSLAQLLALGSTQPDAIRNNAGGHWNHSFFWQLLAPKGGGGQPGGALAVAITKDFGSFDRFKEEFTKAATVLTV